MRGQKILRWLLPLIVLGAIHYEIPLKLTNEELQNFWKLRQEMLQEISQRSTRGRLVMVPDTDHMIQWDQPQVVIENIVSLLH